MHSEGISQHPVWNALEEARQKLEGLAENVLGSETPAAVDILESIRVAQTLKGLRPVYVTEEKLDELQKSAETVSQTVVRSLEEEESVAEELESLSQAIAEVLLTLPVNLHTVVGIEETQQSLQTFATTLADTADHLKEKNQEADGLLAEYEERVSQKQAKIDEDFKQRQEALEQQLSELKSSYAEIKDTIEQQKTRLDEALNAFSEKTSSQVQETNEKHKILREKFEEDSELQRLEIEDKAKTIINQLTEYEGQASRLVESAAKGTITTEYGARAKTEGRAALAWSVGAVLVALLGLGVLVLGMGNIDSLTVPQTIWKFSVTLVLLTVAGYMGSEAGGHRREERDAKRTQLDLNAFYPFLSEMKEDHAADLRKEFAQRVFSRPLANQKNHNGFSLLPLPRKNEDDEDDASSQKPQA